MSDPLRLVLPADGQRSFLELQAEFRAANRERVRRMLRKDSLVRYRKDGTVAGRLEPGLMTTAPEGQDWRTTRDFLAAGGRVPEFDNGFIVLEGAGLDKELEDLVRDANAYAMSETVTYPKEATDADGPETKQCSGPDDERGGGADGSDASSAAVCPWSETERDGRPFADGDPSFVDFGGSSGTLAPCREDIDLDD